MGAFLASRKILVGFFFMMSVILFSHTTDAQVVLYMELMKEEKPIKYYPGQYLSIKSAEYPDEWLNISISKILDEEKIILYDGGMLRLQDIIEVRRSRGWSKIVGYMLKTFGAAWLGFGGIAHFTTDYKFGADTAIIGGGAVASGWLIQKLFKYKKYKVGKKVRLKILDLSWPEPKG